MIRRLQAAGWAALIDERSRRPRRRCSPGRRRVPKQAAAGRAKSVLLWPMTRCGGRYASIANCASGSLPTDAGQLWNNSFSTSCSTAPSPEPRYATAGCTRSPRTCQEAAEAPLECLELGESQTALSGCIDHVAWHDRRLEVHGWAFIRGLDLSSDDATADCLACRTGDRLLPPVRRYPAHRHRQPMSGRDFATRT